MFFSFRYPDAAALTQSGHRAPPMRQPPSGNARTAALWVILPSDRDYPMSTHAPMPCGRHFPSRTRPADRSFKVRPCWLAETCAWLLTMRALERCTIGERSA
jgi:hypothetical protein